jgi:hypothetical protein
MRRNVLTRPTAGTAVERSLGFESVAAAAIAASVTTN